MSNLLFTRRFRINYLAYVVSTVFLGIPLCAGAAQNTNLSEDAALNEAELETVHVWGKRSPVKSGNASGLGEIKKISGRLQREQVENIRDLVRYDPGIAVNESGGRGTSRGYAIRGVEKERVAVTVDGMGQAVMLKRRDRTAGLNSASRSSGAQNEVEYENLKEVVLNKGSASFESGSGALGGAVAATTKDVSDFLDEGENFSGRFKTGFTSKDMRKMGSLALAGRIGDFEGFIQYTHRDGHETKAHGDLYKQSVYVQNYSDASRGRLLSANQVSGTDAESGAIRRIPNPLDYLSGSWLSKFGWNLTPEHYVGAVVENSRQKYQVRDMFVPNYHGARTIKDVQEPLYEIDSDVIKYTPTRFYVDDHDNRRLGIEYKYRASENDSGWLPDTLTLRADSRDLQLKTTVKTLNCSPWPSIDINCWPEKSADNVGKRGYWLDTVLAQKDKRFELDAGKQWQFKDITYDLYFRSGYTQSQFDVDERARYVKVDPTITGFEVSEYDYSDHAGPIKGKHWFVSMGNHVDLDEKVSLSGGVRYDRHNFSAKPDDEQKKRGIIFTNSHYGNLSWDLGVQYRPVDGLAFSYRNSSGFRVPSIVEQLGPDFNISSVFLQHQPPKAEKSLNNEIGINWQSPLLKFSGSYFWTSYRDLIGVASKPKPSGIGHGDNVYYNLHRVKTYGFDVSAYVDGNTLWQKLPEGLRLFARVSQTKHKGTVEISPEYSMVFGYSLDAIQPLRIVYGIDYNRPDDKWGINFTTTYSKAKNPNELVLNMRQGREEKVSDSMDVRTKSWRIADLSGHYRFGKNSVLRAGVYNLFNYRYTTWESLRQTSYGLDARISTPNYTALAAPGRNYQVSFEIKF
ncbi:TonB-dependent hemoglobin/transferrin/lactoferrin family receptor [Neisseria sp. S1]|uniref:TonB-dependent hemoglobin/transferrin/lactoferrin family receptor n=1 Tax=Neisseria sp. S1 TaxID=3318354 RepID=UPI003A88C125